VISVTVNIEAWTVLQIFTCGMASASLRIFFVGFAFKKMLKKRCQIAASQKVINDEVSSSGYNYISQGKNTIIA